MFRQVNERLHALATIGDAPEIHERFVCECFQAGCSAVIELTPGEYRAVRAHSARFLVVPDAVHVDASLERILERSERYWVVEKQGRAATTAEDLAEDPPVL
jgi:hypothetical protein